MPIIVRCRAAPKGRELVKRPLPANVGFGGCYSVGWNSASVFRQSNRLSAQYADAIAPCVLRRFTTGIPSARFEPTLGVATLSGVEVETDDATGLALRIAPVRIGGRLEPALPGFCVGRGPAGSEPVLLTESLLSPARLPISPQGLAGHRREGRGREAGGRKG
jgi:hypothetical protein